MHKKRSLIFKYAFLSLLAFVSVFPFLWMLICSTNTTLDINRGVFSIGNQLLRNFESLFSEQWGFLNALKNSAVISVIATLLSIFVSSMAGYGFEVFRTKNRDRLFHLLLLSMMVPFATLMVPLFRLFSSFNNLGLEFIGLDSFGSVILPSISTAFIIFFFRQNTKAFPKEIVEAARIDGVGEFGIFLKMYMPVMRSTYAAAAIITFMNSWNSYLWPLVTLRSTSKKTVPLILSTMGASYTPDYGMIMAGIVLTTLPTAFIFFLMQRQFVSGMLGSVK